MDFSDVLYLYTLTYLLCECMFTLHYIKVI